PLCEVTASFPAAARIVIALVVLGPFGFLLGAALPLAARLVATRSPALLPWTIAVFSIAALASLAFGAALALELGFSLAALAGSVGSFVAASSVPRAAEQSKAALSRATRPEWLLAGRTRTPLIVGGVSSSQSGSRARDPAASDSRASSK